MVQSLTLSLNPQLILKPILTHKKPFKRVPEASEKDSEKTLKSFLVRHPKSTTISPRKVITPTHVPSRDQI